MFVGLTVAARAGRSLGADEGLEEWRPAAACERWRCRPDGYGSYRCGAGRFGFFLEFDRGTERASQYRIKLATYYRYRDSGSYRRDFQSFPCILVVTVSEVAEARFAYQAYLAEERAGQPLSIFLTTTRRVQADARGILGRIWRRPGPAVIVDGSSRMSWLPQVRGA